MIRKKIKEILHVKVSCTNDQGTVAKTIKVPASDFKKIFEIIRRELPAAYTSLGDFDAKEEYLTKIYHRDEKTEDVEYHSELGGWVEFENVSPRFYVGEYRFYAGMEILPTLVPYRNHREIFIDGFSLANIFAKNRRKASIRLSSTKAYLQEFITKMRDNLVLLDDFSNTVGASNNQARENA